MLRPTATRICRSGSRPARLRGRILDGAFHGRGYDYAVEIGEGVQLMGVFDRRRFDRGSVVDMFVHQGGTLVFPDDGEREAPSLAADAVVTAADPSALVWSGRLDHRNGHDAVVGAGELREEQ